MAERKILALAAAMLLFIGMFAFPVSVKISASDNDTGKITVDCGIEGMQWKLYEVSRVTDDGSLEPVKTFDQFPVPTFWGIKEEIQELAYTIENYITFVRPAHIRTGKTDRSGKVVFEDLEEGWYIAVPKSLKVGDTEYFSSSVMVCVTSHHLYNDFWGMDVTVQPKVSNKIKTEESKKVVIIQYEPDPDDPPDKQVIVIIYRDGSPYEHVILDETNNWTYVVPDVPDDDSEWVIIQKDTPDDTYPIYDKESIIVEETPTDVITVWNKKDKFVVPPSTTPTPDQTRPVTQVSHESGAPNVTYTTYENSLQIPTVTTVPSEVTNAVTSQVSDPVTSVSSEKKETQITTHRTPPEKDSSLPQTGQLWWPVPVMTASGLLLTVTGLIIKKKDQG